MILKRTCRLHGVKCAVAGTTSELHLDHVTNFLLFARLARPGGCVAAGAEVVSGPSPQEAVVELGADLQTALEQIAAYPLPEKPIGSVAVRQTTFELPVKCPEHGWEVAAFRKRRGQAEDTMAAILCEVAAHHAESCEHFQLIVRYARQPLVPHGKAYSYARWMQGWAAVLLDACRGGDQVVADGLCHVTTSR
jgi:hypothetical protein